MISKSSFHGLIAAFVCGLCMIAHTPLANATFSPAQAPRTQCPIRSALLAFTTPSAKLLAGLRASSKASASSRLVASPRAAGATVLRVASIMPQLAGESAPAPKLSANVEIETAAKKAAAAAARAATAGAPLDVHVMGLSIHHATVDVREKLAIKQPDWAKAAAELVASSGGVIEEAAILSTCHRFELYVGASDSRAAMRCAAAWLEVRSGLSQGKLRKNLFMLSGEDCGWHLLRVAAGLDSLVVGEGQILAQVAACFQCATQAADDAAGVVAGSGGKVLSRLLNVAVAAGKRVRAETAISKGAVSISSAAVEFSMERLPKVIGKSLAEASVCIVGAGTMTRLLVTHLKSHGVTKVVLVNRSVGPGSRAQELADEHPDVAWTFATPDGMYAAVAQCDVAYMSTSAEEPILTVQGLNSHVFPTRDVKERGLAVVDISVPRNVETAVDALAGVASFNVDDLKAVVARNTASRRREMLEAEALLKQELGEYLGWHQSLGAVPTIARLQESAEAMRMEEFAKNEKKLKNLSDKELEAVERLSRGIVNKLLHGPMAHLRAPEAVEDKRRTLSTLSALFKLDGASKGKK
jgi:glutamyl-tRNA reductase